MAHHHDAARVAEGLASWPAADILPIDDWTRRLHEESAVAIAQGYAKVTGRAMGAIVHSNVGLMHATMAIFNAWCDRMPVIVLGATGPVDAVKRRPWIDWMELRRSQWR